MLVFYARFLKDKVKSHLFSPPSFMLSLKTKTNPTWASCIIASNFFLRKQSVIYNVTQILIYSLSWSIFLKQAPKFHYLQGSVKHPFFLTVCPADQFPGFKEKFYHHNTSLMPTATLIEI